MSKRSSFMQRFGRQHVTGPKTLLRSVRNQFHTNLPLNWERRSRKRLVVVRSEFLRQFVLHIDCRLQVFSLELGEFMAARSNEDISETENFFSNFYCVSEIYVKFGVF